MNTNINIKGLFNKEALKNKNLNLNSLNTIKGSIKLKESITELFEINIDNELTEKSIIPFKDNNLLILKGIISFKIIGSNSENLGVFLKEDYPFLINCSTLIKNKEVQVAIIEGFFNLNSPFELDFSLILLIDDFRNLNTEFNTSTKEEFLNFDFDSEFI